MVSMAIRCWFKVQSWLLLHYYVLRRLCILCNTYHDCWGHRLSLMELIFYIWQLLYMYNVQENIRIFIITLLARCWHFTHMRKVLGWAHHFTIIGEVWAHKTSLTPPLFIGVPVPSKENEWSCIYMLEVSILPLCDFDIWFWNCSECVVFFALFFILLSK